jgi:hypothetical protein
VTTLNLSMPQGETFRAVLTWKVNGIPVDLTSYTARMQARKRVSSAAVLDFTEGDAITLGGTNGSITIDVSATDTALIPAGTYVYDLELDSGGSVRKLVEGTITVPAEVTHD